jgi:predicted acetyltransferase
MLVWMPQIVVRPFEPKDQEGYDSVRSLTYHDGLPVPEERRNPRFATRYVAEVDGAILGAYNFLSMNATRGPAVIPCAGVAGVAVSPDARRGGIGRTMMAWSVRDFKENGFPLASLYAFREPFYGKCGYAVVGKRIRLSVPMHRLAKVESELAIRRLTPDDWEQLVPCYSAFGHQRSGVHLRNKLMWERVLKEHKPLAIYAAGDPVEGYIAVSHAIDFFKEQWISEVAWSSAAGYRGVLAAMHRIGINKSAMAWFEPSDSPYYAQFLDQGVVAELDRPVMFRVCDVPGALRLLKPSGVGAFGLAVSDPEVPENNGPWRVSWKDGAVSVEAGGAADLTMDIQSFSQAFMGEPSLADVANQGRVSVGSVQALEAAKGLLPGLPVFCGDYF